MKQYNTILAYSLGCLQMLSLTALASPTTTFLYKRIVNGEQLSSKLSWMTSIQYRSGSHFCGGSMIRRDMVLTAAHCIHNKTIDQLIGMTVAANRYDLSKTSLEEDGVDFRILQYVIHNDFDPDSFANDIAMLLVEPKEGFEQNLQNIQPIALDQTNAGLFDQAARALKKRSADAVTAVQNTGLDPQSGDINDLVEKADKIQGVDTRSQINQKLYAAGWGVEAEGSENSSNILLRTSMKVAENSRCSSYLNISPLIRPQTMICAVGATFSSDTCQGDSGGPLYTDDGTTQTLVGIVSFGDGCGRRVETQDAQAGAVTVAVPGVYVRASFYQNFIQSYLNMVSVN